MHPITRRYRVDHLNPGRNRLDSAFHTDTLLARTKSLRGNKSAQVYTNGKFTCVYPIKTRSEVGQTLVDFTADVGVMDSLTADQAAEMTGTDTDFVKAARRHRIKLHWKEKGRPNQNHLVEREIGILRQRWAARKTAMQIPARLWDYGLVYEAELLSRMARSNQERSGLEELTGETPDIAEWLDFEFYERVWVLHQATADVGDDVRRLGRWLGISHRVGSRMCYWILLESGKVISSTTVEHVTRDELLHADTKQKIDTFDERLTLRLNDENFISDDVDGTTPYLEDTEINPPEVRTGITPTDEDYGDMIVTDKLQDADEYDDLDKYIGAQLLLDAGGEPLQARVIKRSRGPDGEVVGRYHANPIFDTRAYLVELADGTVDEYTANVIAENLYSQVDDEGHSHLLMSEISDHRKDGTALDQQNGYTMSRNGNKVPKRTTKGWQLLVEWKDGSSDWISLTDLKDSNPLEVAEYAVANKIDHEPAFKWWMPQVLKHRHRIIAKTQNKYWRTTHKFGIELPHSAQEALDIDKRTGTDFWSKAMAKEQRKVKVAWTVDDTATKEDVRAGKHLIGYTEIKCHMIFDVKMDFTRKARFVAGGHLTEPPLSITYSSVVSRDSVRLALLHAAINGLDLMACDVGNAYLHAPCKEKVWFLGGTEAGEDKGKVLVITRALYGLKSSGASWRSMLAQSLRDMGFDNTIADPDVWRRSAKTETGKDYYELLLVYVDDILLSSHDPKPTMELINTFYELKEPAAAPETYLGAQIYLHSLADGTSAWAMSSEKYVKNAVASVETMLDKEDGSGLHLKTTAKVPFPTTYRPELDMSPELDAEGLSRYRQLIGILRWAVEIGRVDIYLETALLSQYLASPRQGHLEATYHIFAYLKKHPKSAIVFDPIAPELDESAFRSTPTAAWRDFYGDVSEELPPNMPEPKGAGVVITCFVDANHAGNVVTRRSHTGILIFVQNAPIIWFSKKQNTVESASFGSEFVALRAARDMIVALRYKLRMFGIPVIGPANVLCDNEGVVKNTSIPESTLSKRHNSINYHTVRESAAAGILRVGKEDGETNLSDVFTKVLGRTKRYQLFSKITYSSMYGAEGPPKKRVRIDDVDPVADERANSPTNTQD